MDTKTYTCNSDLEDILYRYGFADTTKKYDQIKGKREFRKGKTSSIVIYQQAANNRKSAKKGFESFPYRLLNK